MTRQAEPAGASQQPTSLSVANRTRPVGATAQGTRDGRLRLAPGRDPAGDAAPWIERLGRFGYAAKGVVYALVGVLALQAAFGAGGATTGTRGALEQLLRAPLGQ